MKGYVYILTCKNGRFYVGSTNNIERRLKEHQEGKSSYTKNLRPVRLVYIQEFETIHDARKNEYYIKRQKDSNYIRKLVSHKNMDG